MAEPKLIPVFIPALVVLLVNLERKKGSPLTEQEVIDIRDKGVCMTLPVDQAKALADKRGYDDIDPQNAWAEWQRIRVELAGAEQGEPPAGDVY